MSFLATLLSFLKSLGIILGFIKQALPTPTDKIEDDKKKLDAEEDHFKKTGRPAKWED